MNNAEKNWDSFVKNSSLGSIHQTSAWGHFQESIPERGKSWIITLEEQGKITAGTVLVRYSLPKGYCWLYAPRGPLIDFESSDYQKQMDALLKKIEPIAKKENAIFLRIDPPLKVCPKLKGFHDIKHGFQPEHTLIIDLTQSEEDILKDMKQKGRYNIKIAEKKGVKIRISDFKDKVAFNKDLSSFHDLLKETFSRDKFSGHPKEYYKNMVEILGENNEAALYLAEYEGEVIAGLLATFFADTAIYYFGASGNEFRNAMAPYLLQWTAIRDAKKRGLSRYDFLGIAPSGAKNHPWQGVTSFKTKFGGQEISFAPAKEQAFKPFLYFLYRIYKRLR